MTCRIAAPWGTSGIIGMIGYEKAELLVPEPNTNLLYPRTLLPTLHTVIPPGEILLCCVVWGYSEETKEIQIPKEVMQYVPLG